MLKVLEAIYKQYLLNKRRENYNRVIIPVIREVYPNTIAKDIVGVQPMTIGEFEKKSK